MSDITRLLDLGSLTIDAVPRPGDFERWFDTTIRVDADPFSGTVETIFTSDDLLAFAAALEREVPGRVMLGGGRACEVELIVEWENGVAGGALAVECSVTPSGDDPYPRLRFLTFSVAPFAAGAVERISALVGVDPWPTPELP